MRKHGHWIPQPGCYSNVKTPATYMSVTVRTHSVQFCRLQAGQRQDKLRHGPIGASRTLRRLFSPATRQNPSCFWSSTPLHARNNMSASPEGYVTLVSGDGFEFVLPRSTACVSGTIRRMLEPSSTPACSSSLPCVVRNNPYANHVER